LNTWSSLAVEAEEAHLNKAAAVVPADIVLQFLEKTLEAEHLQNRHLLLPSQLLTPLR
jgi:hypothetical protein